MMQLLMLKAIVTVKHGLTRNMIRTIYYLPSSVSNIYIYLNVLQQEKLELNESTKSFSWLSLRDTSPWRATNSEECDVVWDIYFYIYFHVFMLLL